MRTSWCDRIDEPRGELSGGSIRALSQSVLRDHTSAASESVLWMIRHIAEQAATSSSDQPQTFEEEATSDVLLVLHAALAFGVADNTPSSLIIVARVLHIAGARHAGPLLSQFKSSMHCKIVHAQLEADSANKALQRVIELRELPELSAALVAILPEEPSDLSEAFSSRLGELEGWDDSNALYSMPVLLERAEEGFGAVTRLHATSGLAELCESEAGDQALDPQQRGELQAKFEHYSDKVAQMKAAQQLAAAQGVPWEDLERLDRNIDKLRTAQRELDWGGGGELERLSLREAYVVVLKAALLRSWECAQEYAEYDREAQLVKNPENRFSRAVRGLCGTDGGMQLEQQLEKMMDSSAAVVQESPPLGPVKKHCVPDGGCVLS